MVTTADLAAFQQQLRQAMAGVRQQLRTEMNETISGRIVMVGRINSALQIVSAKTIVSKPYRISDFIPETGKAATTRDNLDMSCRTCTCECKLWSAEGETMPCQR